MVKTQMKMTKTMMSAVQGVSNVYAQHVPLMMDLVTKIFKNKTSSAGSIDGSYPAIKGGGGGEQCKEIIIYVIGGITYEEARAVADFNRDNASQGWSVMVGGSTVHNSTSFLEELKSL